MTIKLSALSVLLGLGLAAPQVFALLKPGAFAQAARRFPRSQIWGYALVSLGTFWFLYYLAQESVSDFAAYKPMMFLGFGLIGLLTCVFLRDFLAIRGLAVVLLLLAKLMVDSARWEDTGWRLVIVTWAYVLALAGMWFTISPWRCRDLIHWGTANERRIRVGSGFRLAFGLLVIILGLTVF